MDFESIVGILVIAVAWLVRLFASGAKRRKQPEPGPQPVPAPYEERQPSPPRGKTSPRGLGSGTCTGSGPASHRSSSRVGAGFGGAGCRPGSGLRSGPGSYSGPGNHSTAASTATGAFPVSRGTYFAAGAVCDELRGGAGRSSGFSAGFAALSRSPETAGDQDFPWLLLESRPAQGGPQRPPGRGRRPLARAVVLAEILGPAPGLRSPGEPPER